MKNVQEYVEYSMIHFATPADWSDTDRLTVECAAHVIGVALARFTGLDPAASFEQVFGDQYATISPSLATPGNSTENRIEFRPHWVILPLVGHELGHTFDRLAGGLPRQMLRHNGITYRYMWKRPPENGHQWWGCHPVYDPGGEDENERWADTFGDYCLGMLAWNKQGRALTAWMEANMPQWIGGLNV